MADSKSILQSLDLLTERLVYADSMARIFTNVMHDVSLEKSDDYQWCFVFRQLVDDIRTAAEDLELRLRVSLDPGGSFPVSDDFSPPVSFKSADSSRPRSSGAGA